MNKLILSVALMISVAAVAAKVEEKKTTSTTTTSSKTTVAPEMKAAQDFLGTKGYPLEKVTDIQPGKDGAFMATTTANEVCSGNVTKKTLNCVKKPDVKPASGDSD